MIFTLTGASGFVGRALRESLVRQDRQVRVLSRRGGDFAWDSLSGPAPSEAFEGADAVVHLAGESVAQRWTPAIKRAIRESRVLGTQHLVQGLSTARRRPAALVCASAVGFYGDRGEEILTEADEAGEGFLARTCVEWEKSASLAASLGLRVVCLRIGMVLGPGGGALAKMLLPFRLGLGGPVAGGRQWTAWIHVDDLVRLILFAVENDALAGPVNAVAPQLTRNREFSRALGRALRRPAILPTPGFAVRALFGEMAQIVTGSQRVLPRVAEAAGFRFQYPELDAALRAVCAA